jgi:putative transposase
MCNELEDLDIESLRLPKGWAANVRNALLNVVGLVRIAMLTSREFLIEKGDVPTATILRLETEVAMLREENRINGNRMARIDPCRRPQYTPIERMAILELRAMRGWSQAETARRFHVSDATIRSWLRRADDDSLIQTKVPVNRFPDFVRYVVQQIKLFCPMLGKAKIADKLARVGIHIGKTTVQRILKEKPAQEPEPSGETGKQCRIVAKSPSHTMHADLTVVPNSGGFWTNWFPFTLSQTWPTCFWLLNVVDHYSRRSMGFAVFKSEPSSEEVTAALGRMWLKEGVRPKHLIVDQGPMFKCKHFKKWCKNLNIKYRFGAVGQHGSIAVIERFHRTVKEILRLIIIPEEQSLFETEMDFIVRWYNEHRPHETLDGKTPNEVYFSRKAANEQPRYEPRERWPRGSPCASPQVEIDGEPGDAIILEIDCLDGRRHLPVLRTRRAA